MAYIKDRRQNEDTNDVMKSLVILTTVHIFKKKNLTALHKLFTRTYVLEREFALHC